jgi:hypothetical protein
MGLVPQDARLHSPSRVFHHRFGCCVCLDFALLETWAGPTSCYPSRSMATAKQQVESLLHKLPENCTLEDIQYHLYVLDKVRQGLEDARQRGTVSQEEAEKQLSKWLTE